MRLDAIVEIPLRGEGQTVTGLGTVEQLRIPRADSARVLREPLDGADSLCLSVANLRNYRSQDETELAFKIGVLILLKFAGDVSLRFQSIK